MRGCLLAAALYLPIGLDRKRAVRGGLVIRGVGLGGGGQRGLDGGFEKRGWRWLMEEKDEMFDDGGGIVGMGAMGTKYVPVPGL